MFVFANIITSTKSIKTNLTQVNKSRCWPAGRRGILHICNSDAVFLFSINQCDSAKMDNTFFTTSPVVMRYMHCQDCVLMDSRQMKSTSLTEKTVLNREIESTMQAGENIQAHQVTD